MSFVHGKNTVVKIDSSGGSLVDLSAYINQSDFDQMIETAETTTFGAAAKTRIGGLADGSMSCGGPWDATLDAHMNGIYGQSATVTIEFHPAGTGSGTPKYSGEFILANYKQSSGVGDVVTWTADFEPSGAISRGTN